MYYLDVSTKDRRQEYLKYLVNRDGQSYVSQIVGGFYHPPYESIKLGDHVILKKEPDNKYDKNAIAVYNKKHEKVGYIPNSGKTVRGNTYSADKLQPLIGNTAPAVVMNRFENYFVILVNCGNTNFIHLLNQ